MRKGPRTPFGIFFSLDVHEEVQQGWWDKVGVMGSQANRIPSRTNEFPRCEWDKKKPGTKYSKKGRKTTVEATFENHLNGKNFDIGISISDSLFWLWSNEYRQWVRGKSQKIDLNSFLNRKKKISESVRWKWLENENPAERSWLKMSLSYIVLWRGNRNGDEKVLEKI